ncbi:hypothetical protein BC831DRAFT_159879 [Entophlyctis helioformis]|nr:hypothetical protein BC831DRAFT_159879 [Entophlyctis helioformis]
MHPAPHAASHAPTHAALHAASHRTLAHSAPSAPRPGHLSPRRLGQSAPTNPPAPLACLPRLSARPPASPVCPSLPAGLACLLARYRNHIACATGCPSNVPAPHRTEPNHLILHRTTRASAVSEQSLCACLTAPHHLFCPALFFPALPCPALPIDINPSPVLPLPHSPSFLPIPAAICPAFPTLLSSTLWMAASHLDGCQAGLLAGTACATQSPTTSCIQ